MMRSISLTCRATSIDQAISGLPPNERMFFPGMDLLPPRAGMTAATLFPLSISVVPNLSFSRGSVAQPAEAVERLTIFGPLSRIDPGILANGKDADAAAGLLDLLDEIGHVAASILGYKIEPVAAYDIHAGVHEEAVLRLFGDAGEAAAVFQFANTVRNVVVLEGRNQREVVIVFRVKRNQI